MRERRKSEREDRKVISVDIEMKHASSSTSSLSSLSPFLTHSLSLSLSRIPERAQVYRVEFFSHLFSFLLSLSLSLSSFLFLSSWSEYVSTLTHVSHSNRTQIGSDREREREKRDRKRRKKRVREKRRNGRTRENLLLD